MSGKNPPTFTVEVPVTQDDVIKALKQHSTRELYDIFFIHKFLLLVFGEPSTRKGKIWCAKTDSKGNLIEDPSHSIPNYATQKLIVFGGTYKFCFPAKDGNYYGIFTA